MVPAPPPAAGTSVQVAEVPAAGLLVDAFELIDETERLRAATAALVALVQERLGVGLDDLAALQQVAEGAALPPVDAVRLRAAGLLAPSAEPNPCAEAPVLTERGEALLEHAAGLQIRVSAALLHQLGDGGGALQRAIATLAEAVERSTAVLTDRGLSPPDRREDPEP